MLKVSRFVIAFLILSAAAGVAQAQSIHTLQGKVISPSGTQPLNPVMVTLTFSGRPIHKTFTDLSGRFSFTGLSRGTYQLTAEGDRQTFETTRVNAEVSAFGSAPQHFTQDIQLRPISAKRLGQPSVVNAFTQNVPKAARETLERAAKLNRELKTEDAIKQLLEAIRIFPEYFEAHLELGNTFLKAGRLEQAITELDRAREIDPNDERAYQSFGLVMMQQKNYGIAVAVFSEAARLNPVNPFNALMRGTALIHQAYTISDSSTAAAVEDKKYILSRAEVSLTQASNLSDKKAKADHLTLAMFYEMKGDQARAAKELEDYLQKNPNAKNADSLRTIVKQLRSGSDTKLPSRQAP